MTTQNQSPTPFTFDATTPFGAYPYDESTQNNPVEGSMPDSLDPVREPEYVGLDIFQPRDENNPRAVENLAPRRAIEEDRIILGSLRGLLERKRSAPKRAKGVFEGESKEPQRAIEPGYKKLIDGFRNTWDRAKKGLGGVGEKLHPRVPSTRALGAAALLVAAGFSANVAPTARANDVEATPAVQSSDDAHTEAVSASDWGMFKLRPNSNEETTNSAPAATHEPKYANSRRITTEMSVPVKPGDGWSTVLARAAAREGQEVDGYKVYKAVEQILPNIVPKDDIYVRSAADSPRGLEYGVDGTDAVEFNDAAIRKALDEYIQAQPKNEN